jgi:hypothetical protein
MNATASQHRAHRRLSPAGHFGLHLLEMCVPMCIGFAVGDLVYFWVADLFGYSEPFRDLPELSLAVVTFNMTAPMVAWMWFRGMPARPTAEMAAAMIILALVLLATGWLGITAMSGLPWLGHALMMPAMLVPMLLRRDLYSRHRAREHRGHRTVAQAPTVSRLAYTYMFIPRERKR